MSNQTFTNRDIVSLIEPNVPYTYNVDKIVNHIKEALSITSDQDVKDLNKKVSMFMAIYKKRWETSSRNK